MNNKKKLFAQIAPIIILVLAIAALVAVILTKYGESDGNTKANPPVKDKPLFGEVVGDKLIPYFNTSCIIYDYSGMGESEFSALCDDIEELTRYYHRLFDIYHSYDGVVNLNYLNAHAGEEITVSPELYEFLSFCKEMYSLTGGEVNVALGSVLSLWHECRESALSGGAVKIPSEKDISEALLHTDIDNVLLLGDNKIKLADSEMSLDAGAIAKGYAVEKIAHMLEARGLSGIVLDYGGNLRAIGEKPSGDGWVTGIKNPREAGEYIKKLVIKDTSVVTSGDYERYYFYEEKRYHHIIDGATGYPAVGFSSVSIVTKNSALADALSTALFCMDNPDEVRGAVENIRRVLGEEISVVLVDTQGKVTEI